MQGISGIDLPDFEKRAYQAAYPHFSSIRPWGFTGAFGADIDGESTLPYTQGTEYVPLQIGSARESRPIRSLLLVSVVRYLHPSAITE